MAEMNGTMNGAEKSNEKSQQQLNSKVLSVRQHSRITGRASLNLYTPIRPIRQPPTTTLD